MHLPDHRKNRELGFQFMNKSPKIVPPGTLKDVAYSNLEPSYLVKNAELDYLEPEDSLTKSNTKFNSIENNYDSTNMNRAYKSNKFIDSANISVISPGNQNTKYHFNKNTHLMKGVLTQQRRFSRIISSNQRTEQVMSLSKSETKNMQKN